MIFTKKMAFTWASVLILLVMVGFAANRLGIFPLTVFGVSAADGPELRGVWVQNYALNTPQEIDEVVRQAEAGHFNAIFANMFVHGQALYESKLVQKHERVDPAFDPLAYLLEAAHSRDLKVHVWFVNGPVAFKGQSPILVSHPDWGLVGPDGKKTTWLNLARPDVGQFLSEAMLEVSQKYHVDGIHFDYFRYPGPEWGFEADSAEAIRQEYGFDLDELKYTDLPAYATFKGNALSEPKTAQILARFQSGQPAVTLNVYGEGKVIVLNWDATQRQVAIGTEILQRGIDYLLDKDGEIYLLHSETNAAQYGPKNVERGLTWLKNLGYQPIELGEAKIVDLNPNSVLVLPNVYLISPEAAAALANFVRQGGGVIFIDGPTKSIQLKEIQLVTGLQTEMGHFEETTLMVPTGEHPLIPQSNRGQDITPYKLKAEQWVKFRRQRLSSLLEQIYRRLKTERPELVVSITITADQNRARQDVLQDWPAWVAGDYIDLLIPRAFEQETSALKPVLATWAPQLQANNKITLGLIGFTRVNDERLPKSAEELLAEIKLARQAGSKGFMIFHIQYLSEAQLQTLAADFLAPTRAKN